MISPLSTPSLMKYFAALPHFLSKRVMDRRASAGTKPIRSLLKSGVLRKQLHSSQESLVEEGGGEIGRYIFAAKMDSGMGLLVRSAAA